MWVQLYSLEAVVVVAPPQTMGVIASLETASLAAPPERTEQGPYDDVPRDDLL